MKTLLFTSLLFIVIVLGTSPLIAQNGEINNNVKNLKSGSETPIYYLDGNGVTIKCKNCQPGDTGVVNGITYEAVDRNLLIQRRDEGADLTILCTSLVTNMSRMFSGSLIWGEGAHLTLTAFNQNINSWDVSNVKDMSYMFSFSTFNKVIGTWDVSSVTDMSQMFNWSIFNQDIGSWDVSNVRNMRGMFSGSSFNQNLNSWNVSKVTDMSSMFGGGLITNVFNQDIGSWDVSSVKDMSRMFSSDTLFNQDIGSWNVSSVTDMKGMFAGAHLFNYDIGSWVVSNVTDMGYMFYDTHFFNHDIGSWNVSSVTDMSKMFGSAKFFNQDIGGWDVSKVSNMKNMFYGASSFNQDLASWCVTNIKKYPTLFALNSALQENFYPEWGTCPSSSTDIENTNLEGFTIYPNPMGESMLIKTPNGERIQRIELVDISGKVVRNIDQIHSDQLTLTRKGLNSGIYLLKVYADQLYIQKVIIQ